MTLPKRTLKIKVPTELANLIRKNAKEEGLSVPEYIHKVLVETEKDYKR